MTESYPNRFNYAEEMRSRGTRVVIGLESRKYLWLGCLKEIKLTKLGMYGSKGLIFRNE